MSPFAFGSLVGLGGLGGESGVGRDRRRGGDGGGETRTKNNQGVLSAMTTKTHLLETPDKVRGGMTRTTVPRNWTIRRRFMRRSR